MEPYRPFLIPKPRFAGSSAVSFGDVCDPKIRVQALDEPRTASFEFRQAYRDSKDFAAYQGLVSCYIAENRLNEALAGSSDTSHTGLFFVVL